MWAVLSPIPTKREGDSSLLCSLTTRKFFLRLSMISWGKFYVMERFCDFSKRHNLYLPSYGQHFSFFWTYQVLIEFSSTCIIKILSNYQNLIFKNTTKRWWNIRRQNLNEDIETLHPAPTQFCLLPGSHRKTLFLSVSPFSLGYPV